MAIIQPKKILCVGMMTCDSYYYGIDPKYMEKEVAYNTDVKLMAGGDATNVSIDLAALGNDVKIMGCIGNDIHGEGLLGVIARGGVDTSFVRRDENIATSMTLILYTRDCKDSNDRHCSLFHGGNEHLRQEDITDEMLDSVDHLHYGSFGPMTEIDKHGLCTLFERAKAHGCTISMDIKGVGHDYTTLFPALHYVDIFMPNIGEYKDIAGTDDVQEIKEFFRPYNISVLAIKMAEKGVFLTNYKEDIELPTLTRSDEIVDIMGAGDAFCSGLMTAFLDGRDLRECGIMGSMASRHCLQTPGASTWRATADQLAEEAVALGYPMRGF